MKNPPPWWDTCLHLQFSKVLPVSFPHTMGMKRTGQPCNAQKLIQRTAVTKPVSMTAVLDLKTRDSVLFTPVFYWPLRQRMRLQSLREHLHVEYISYMAAVNVTKLLVKSPVLAK